MISDAPAWRHATSCDRPCCPGPLDQHARVVTDAAIEQRPLDTVRHRCHDTGKLGRDRVGHLVDDRIPRQVHVVREAAPQMRRALRGRIAVAQRVGIVAPVGRMAKAILALVAPLALEARHVVLDEHEIAFLDLLAFLELLAGLGNVADVLVPHDDRFGDRRLCVELDVGAADAGDLHLQQRRVGRDVRHRVLAKIRVVRAQANCCDNGFSHASTP